MKKPNNPTIEQVAQETNDNYKKKWKKPEVIDIELNNTEGGKPSTPTESGPFSGPS